MQELKYTELHRHLDASLRPGTVAELSQRFRSEPRYADAEDVRRRLWITHQMRSLAEVLDAFALLPQLFGSADALERIALEGVEDVAAEGTAWVEFRYAPVFAGSRSGLDWGVALDAIWRGLSAGVAATGVRAGLICIVNRDFGASAADKAMDFAIAHRDRFIAVDLAGAELGHPCRDFAPMFRRAADAGLAITIHAGEADGPRSIWEAIDLCGARRIGHGTTAIEDDALMARLARDRILLEACPTSNYVTRAVADWRDHPLPKFLERGIPVSVSTDDPAIFGVTLPEELRRCRERIGLSDADIARTEAYAREHSFLARSPAAIG